MPVPQEILRELRTFLDVEIQSGRRHAPLDPEAVSAFLKSALTFAKRPYSSSSLANALISLCPVILSLTIEETLAL